jgi:hypothetical protein
MNTATATNTHLDAAQRAYAEYIERGCPPEMVAARGRIDVSGRDYRWEGSGVASVTGAPEGVVLITTRRASHIIVSQQLRVDEEQIMRPIRGSMLAPGIFHLRWPDAGLVVVSMAFIVLLGSGDLS